MLSSTGWQAPWLLWVFREHHEGPKCGTLYEGALDMCIQCRQAASGLQKLNVSCASS